MLSRADDRLHRRNWHIATERVSGNAHRGHNKPCQDDIRYDDSDPFRVILAAADGHGSEKSPKSALGAEIAVRRAVEQLREFSLGVAGKPFDVVKKFAEDELPRRLVKRWIDAVLAKEPDRQDLATTLLEYGSTLLSVLVTRNFILYLQLGDGDILRVGADSEVTRPIPRNPQLFANETTSLSMVDRRTGQPNGFLEMAVALEAITEYQRTPELIVVSTDGYANSFLSDADFLLVGSDILHMIHDEGWARVKEELPRWLVDATILGSGDDISVGLLWNSEAGTLEAKERES